MPNPIDIEAEILRMEQQFDPEWASEEEIAANDEERFPGDPRHELKREEGK
jgi:hypothetical protein